MKFKFLMEFGTASGILLYGIIYIYGIYNLYRIYYVL